MKVKVFIFSLLFALPFFTLASNNFSFLASIYCSTLGSWFGDNVCEVEKKDSVVIPEALQVQTSETVSSTTQSSPQIIKQYITQPTMIEKIVQAPSIDMSNYVTKDFFRKQIESTQESSVDSISSSISGSTVIDDRISTYLSGNSIPTLTASSILPSTVGASAGTVFTDLLTGTDVGNYGLYNDQQKFIAVGTDGFVRFVYFDNDFTDVHFVRCLDNDCTTRNNTIVASSVDGVDSTIIVMGSDGFARIVYIDNYESVHFIKCSNADCSDKTDNIVSTSSLYEIGFNLNSDDLATIVYNNYTDDTLGVVSCSDEECASPIVASAGSMGYGSAFDVQIAPDGFARFAYYDSDPSKAIHFVRCTNTTCSTNINTVVEYLESSNNTYYVSMVLGPDGFGRIAYDEGGVALKYAQCEDIDCSSNTINEVFEKDYSVWGNQTSLVLDSSGLARITLLNEYNATNHYSYYIECNNASCSSSSATKLTSGVYSYPQSMVLGNDGFARIIFMENRRDIKLARLQSSDGGSTVSGSTLGTSASPYGNIFGTKINSQELWSIGDSVRALHIEDSSGNEILNVDSLNGSVDLIADLNVTGTTTVSNLVVEEDLTIGDSFAVGYKKTYSMDRTLGSSRGDTVEIGGVTSDNGGNHMFTIYVLDAVSGGSAAKFFNFSRNYDSTTSGNWVELLPTFSTGPRGVSDVIVDASFASGGPTVQLRLRDKIDNVGGVNSAKVVIETYGNSVFTESSATTTGATVSGIYSNSIFTHIAGKVGIGTSSPQSRLELTQAANTSAGGFRMTSTDGDYRAMFMGTTGILSFTGGDGGTINTATLNAAGAWTNASDIAYKENIVNLDTKYSLADLMKIEPRYYTMKGSDKAQIGFIAQELKPILPEVVEGEEGSMGISYGNMVALLVQGVKELVNMMMDLTHRVETEELCLEKVCITKEQLQKILEATNTTANPYKDIHATSTVVSTTSTTDITEEIIINTNLDTGSSDSIDTVISTTTISDNSNPSDIATTTLESIEVPAETGIQTEEVETPDTPTPSLASTTVDGI